MPVGSYEEGKSPFGIYDMTGSVWEWTNSLFEPFERYKNPKFKMGTKSIPAEPGFSAQCYVIKGGHYLAGELPNRLEIREGYKPLTNTEALGFRCVKDIDPGKTMLNYAIADLEGSNASDMDFYLKNMYAIETAEYTDTEPKVIKSFDYFMLCPVAKTNTTIAKIQKTSPDNPFLIGVISFNRSLEEPNLPPGSYILGYRHQGYSTQEKKDKLRREAEAKRKAEEEAKKKAEEEAEKRRLEEMKKEGVEETPKTQEEIEEEKRQKEEEERRRKIEEEMRRKEAEEKAALEKLGLIATAKEHIPFPRDKNLIVFMNSRDTIVGYIEIPGFEEESGTTPIQVMHAAAEGTTSIGVSVKVLGAKNPRFNFTTKMRENPF